jgi:hypothetical protein
VLTMREARALHRQVEAKEEWWSQEEGASDGGRCEQHRLKLLLLFIKLK